MSKQDLQFIAYELQRQNFAVKQPKSQDSIDNVEVISAQRPAGATPSQVLGLKVTNSDDYAEPDIHSGRWVEIRHENEPRGSEKYEIRASDDGTSGSSRKVDSVSVDDVGGEEAREKVVRKVIGQLT